MEARPCAAVGDQHLRTSQSWECFPEESLAWVDVHGLLVVALAETGWVGGLLAVDEKLPFQCESREDRCCCALEVVEGIEREN